MPEAAAQPPRREVVRILVLSASLRKASLNARLAHLAALSIAADGAIVTAKCMAEFDMPSYDQDIQNDEGFPKGAAALRQALEANDAFVMASPEYNASMPGSLKNAIDWLSRYSPQPFHDRHCLLLSASTSMVGGNRGLWALRVPLEHLGSRVYPDMFSLAQAHQAFDDEGNLVDHDLRARLHQTIIAFLDLVEASKHYPCVKRAWVEFLGERPDPVVDRVDT
jgi:chromate reductase, NAD(P)H dehydrogenase (quinone)